MKNRCPLLILITLSLASLLIASPAAAQRGRFAGSVKDEQGNPIVGIEVKFDKAEAETKYDNKVEVSDEEGRFVFTGLRGGTWILTVNALGYAPFRQVVQISQFRRNEDIVIVLEKLAEAVPETGAREEAEGMIAEAEELLAEGKHDEAITRYNEYLETHPDLFKIHLLIGNAYEKKGDYDNAVASYGKVLELEPDNFNALLGSGNAFIRKMEYEKAEEFFIKLAELRSDDPKILYTLGEILLDSGQTTKAIEYYAKAVELNPNYADALMKLGYAYYGEKQWQNAIDQFEKFIEIAPNRPEVQFIRDDIEKCKQKLAEEK